MRIRFSSLLAATAFLAMSGAASAATLLGATVNVSARYPDANTIYADGGDRVVSNSVEYQTGAFAGYNGEFSADVQGDGFILSIASNPGFGNADFNGFVLRNLSGPTITSVSFDPASDFSPVTATISGDSVYLNYSGVSSADGGNSIVRFGFGAVSAGPEPATWAMMIVGFGMAGGTLRRSRRLRIGAAATFA